MAAVPNFATEPADLLKIALMSWFGIFVINKALRAMGLAQYTTKGS
jgi:hypothetical protein